MGYFFRVSACIGICLSVAACGPKMTAAEQAAIQKEAQKTVTCQAGADCKLKWELATEWVARYSHYGIRVASSRLIQTTGPLHSSTNSAFTITKFPTKDRNVYNIEFQSFCDNWLGCKPSEDELKAYFNYFITHP